MARTVYAIFISFGFMKLVKAQAQAQAGPVRSFVVFFFVGYALRNSVQPGQGTDFVLPLWRSKC